MCCGNKEENVKTVAIKFIGKHWIGDRVRIFSEKLAGELKSSGLWVDVENEIDTVESTVDTLINKNSKKQLPVEKSSETASELEKTNTTE